MDQCETPIVAEATQPPTVRYADQAYRITQPVIVHSRADIASLLRAHRIASNEGNVLASKYTHEQFGQSTLTAA